MFTMRKQSFYHNYTVHTYPIDEHLFVLILHYNNNNNHQILSH